MTVENLNTGVGRIVWGNPARATIKKDQRTKQPVMKDGKPVEQWAFGVAFPKAEFMQKVLPYLQQEAAGAYPHGTPANFSWKYKDGDGVDSAGKPFNTREGYAGCFVLTVSSTAFAPPIYKFENGAYRQIGDNEIKCGDFVAVSLNIKANIPTDRTHTPGLYVNPNGICLVGYGTEIVGSANPDEMFGGQQYQLPPGASNMPIASAAPIPGAPVPGMQNSYAPGYPAPAAAPQPYAPQQPAPQQQYQPAPAPAPQPQGYPAPQGYAPAPVQYAPAPAAPQPGYPPVAPAHDFVHNAGQPQPQPMQQYAGMPGIPQGR